MKLISASIDESRTTRWLSDNDGLFAHQCLVGEILKKPNKSIVIELVGV